MSDLESDRQPPPERGRIVVVPIAITIVSSLSMGGALGVAIGASTNDFPFGLKLGFSIGAAVGATVYWFALRDRKPRA